jgi:hypothetical protein
MPESREERFVYDVQETVDNHVECVNDEMHLCILRDVCSQIWGQKRKIGDVVWWEINNRLNEPLGTIANSVVEGKV